MKALVTGASGFIGSTLIEELGTLGFDVYALMRRTSVADNLEGLRYQRVEGDLSDEASLRRAVRGMDYVYHLAGVTAGPGREYFIKHNTDGTARLAQVVAEEQPGLSRFVYVSSLAAGGPADSLQPRTEVHDDKPVSAYGESKLLAERELLRYKSVYPITIVRPPMVYGPKDKAVFVVIRTVSKNVMPLLRGSAKGGHKYYSAIHSKDLTRGMVQAGLAPKDKVPSGEIFYLSDNSVYSYQEFLSTIAERLNLEPYRVRVPKLAVMAAAAGLTAAGWLLRRNFPLNLDKLNELLPDYWICSNQKARSLLGFKPEFDLATGMQDTIEWYKKQRWL